jgi:hypothetical protein
MLRHNHESIVHSTTTRCDHFRLDYLSYCRRSLVEPPTSRKAARSQLQIPAKLVLLSNDTVLYKQLWAPELHPLDLHPRDVGRPMTLTMKQQVGCNPQNTHLHYHEMQE